MPLLVFVVLLDLIQGTSLGFIQRKRAGYSGARVDFQLEAQRSNDDPLGIWICRGGAWVQTSRASHDT